MGRRKTKSNLDAVVITAERYRELRTDPPFVHIMNLMRAVNTVRFVTDAILSNVRGNSTRARRARSSSGLLLAAATNEAIAASGNPTTRAVLHATPGFAEIQAWRDHALTIHMSRPKGFIDRVRDHSAFHYVPQKFGTWAKRYEPDDLEVVAAVGQERSSGPFFLLADMVASLEVSDEDPPSSGIEAEFIKRFPFVSRVSAEPMGARPTVVNYMRCINATMLLSVAFTHLVERMVAKQQARWSLQRATLGTDDQLRAIPQVDSVSVQATAGGKNGSRS